MCTIIRVCLCVCACLRLYPIREAVGVNDVWPTLLALITNDRCWPLVSDHRWHYRHYAAYNKLKLGQSILAVKVHGQLLSALCTELVSVSVLAIGAIFKTIPYIDLRESRRSKNNKRLNIHQHECIILNIVSYIMMHQYII